MQEHRVEYGSEAETRPSPDSETQASANTENRASKVDRRAFLSTYGKVALVAPPVLTALLSTSMSSPAIAQSAGSSGGSGGEVMLFGAAGAGAIPLVAGAGRQQAAVAPVPTAVPVAAPVPVAPAPPPPPAYVIAGERG